MCATDFFYDSVVELAEGLARRAPGPGPWRVFFANSGAEAVEGAIKLARLRTGRQKIVAFYGAFHGRTYGAMSLTASKPVQRRGYGPFVPEIVPLPLRALLPLPGEPRAGDLRRRVPGPPDEDDVRHHHRPAGGGGGDRGAGPGGGRLRRAPSGLPEAAARASRASTASCSSPTRCSAAWAGPAGSSRASTSACEPDIVTLAKGIASGMPLGRAPRQGLGDAVERRRPRVDLRGQPGVRGRGSRHLPPARKRPRRERRARGGSPHGRLAVAARALRCRRRHPGTRAHDRGGDREGPRARRSRPPSCASGSSKRPSALASCSWVVARTPSASRRRSSSTARTPRSRPASSPKRWRPRRADPEPTRQRPWEAPASGSGHRPRTALPPRPRSPRRR